ncbi:MAG: nucleotidyl transferase AbiEii/AbiGii toxin family protein [Candidatus ainarchaeum sp.]|nr:nucleotidyl transferase AbiEii/AbiGii toxin family protein [Candidatus ainarchaeum sp.]
MGSVAERIKKRAYGVEGVLMITLSELKRIAVRVGVPQAVVEKDFVLSVALKAIAESELTKHVVFKGGTVIRKVYFREARFSEDLDFNAIDVDRNDCMKLLKEALGGKLIEAITFENVEEEKTPAGLKASVKYVGPLAHAQRIRFDFNFRKNLVEEPVRRPVIDSYGLGTSSLLVLSLGEIFAEKLHALGSRSAPRDLYDAWFLFGKGVKIDKQVLDKKFAYYNETFDAKKAIENARKDKDNWKRDLRHLLKELPEFELLETEVEKKLREIS